MPELAKVSLVTWMGHSKNFILCFDPKMLCFCCRIQISFKLVTHYFKNKTILTILGLEFWGKGKKITATRTKLA